MVIKITPRDRLVTRATVALHKIARFDTCDLTGEFEEERFSHYAELHTIQEEARRIGDNWSEIYDQVVMETEIYECGHIH